MTRIKTRLSKSSMGRIRKLLKMTHGARFQTTSCILQVFEGGKAVGLYLPNKESLEIQEILKPMWNKAIEYDDSDDIDIW